ncbi:hypothetical protein JRO89_XS11G0196600 [Xanthoceras sorbifolium]|uniref:Uncharacterized protein n=1 Tax=Xanthoceras sorbifolium TaxID=99658 RepID=A0ABQ8HGA5_9ROSI|nr:hypothetical protein JRO89_XS11G0196600 [Xanthoceras sorbifolium]
MVWTRLLLDCKLLQMGSEKSWMFLTERKKKKNWDEKNQEAIAKGIQQLDEFDQVAERNTGRKGAREDLQKRIDFLRKSFVIKALIQGAAAVELRVRVEKAPKGSPLFRIPVTIFKPMAVSTRPPIVSFAQMSFLPANVQRRQPSVQRRQPRVQQIQPQRAAKAAQRAAKAAQRAAKAAQRAAKAAPACSEGSPRVQRRQPRVQRRQPSAQRRPPSVQRWQPRQQHSVCSEGSQGTSAGQPTCSEGDSQRAKAAKARALRQPRHER